MSEKFEKLINIDINSASLNVLENHLKDINLEIKEIKESEISLNQSLEEHNNSISKLNDLEKLRDKISKKTDEDKIKRNELAIKKADDFKKAAEGIAGGFQIATSSSLLFGEKTGEELAKAQAKVIGLVAAVDGAKKIVEGSVAGYKLLQDAIKQTTILSKIFGTTSKTAIISTGIGILILALGLVYTYFEKITQAAKDFSKSIGLTDLINQFNEFSDRIGGIGGIMTVVGGTIKGIFKEILNIGEIVIDYFKIVGNILVGNFDAAKKASKELNNDLKEIGKATIDETKKAVIAAEKEAAIQRELLRKESLIKVREQEIAILKAQGKSTLDLEKQNIDSRLELIKYRLIHVKNGSEEEIKITDDLNKEILNLEANKKAQIDKFFEDSLKNNSKQYNNRLKLLTDNLNQDLNKEEDFNKKKYILDLNFINEEISLRKKRNEDITTLELSKSNLILNENKRLNGIKKEEEEKALQIKQDILDKELDILDKQLIEAQIVQNQAFIDGLIDEETYNSNLKTLEQKFIDEKLLKTEKGTKEYLDLQKQSNLDEIENKKLSLKEKNDLDKYYSDLEISNLQKTANNVSNTYSVRKEAIKDLEKVQTEALKTKQKELEAAGKIETTEYKQLGDKIEEINSNTSKNITALLQERISKIGGFAQQAIQAISGISDILTNIENGKIDEINNKITKFEELNESIQKSADETKTKIEENNAEIEESTNKINELEKKLENDRGGRAAQIEQELQRERKNRNKQLKDIDKLKKEQKKLALAEIENQKNIQKEKDKAEALELQQKKRAKVIAIAQAVINTALAVSAALTIPPPVGTALAVVNAALGAVQIGVISSQKLEHGGIIQDGLAIGASHQNGGIKVLGGKTEIEGGEFVVNKHSTKTYLPLLQAINGNKIQTNFNKLADGGIATTDFNSINKIQQTQKDLLIQQTQQPIFVSITDINTGQNRVAKIIDSSGF